MTTLNSQKLLNRSEVEAEFGISKRYLELATLRGEGPSVIRIGRLVRYRPADIIGWIEANRVDPRNGSA